MKASEGQQRDEGGLLKAAPSIVAAAHELKSPLALIRQLAFMAEQHPERAAEYAERIVLTTDRALRLTGDITKAARLEDSFFETEPLSAQRLLEEIADEMSPLYRAQGRLLSVAKRRSSPLVVANHDLIRRILLGFTDNALHYASENAPVELSLRAHPSRQTVRLVVRDFGPAVATDTLQKTSETLGAQPVSASLRPSSSGLGLYLARQFAAVIHAEIGFVRHRDGASFYIDVPSSTQLSLL